jgi:hypothetical protein
VDGARAEYGYEGIDRLIPALEDLVADPAEG